MSRLINDALTYLLTTVTARISYFADIAASSSQAYSDNPAVSPSIEQETEFEDGGADGVDALIRAGSTAAVPNSTRLVDYATTVARDAILATLRRHSTSDKMANFVVPTKRVRVEN